MGITTFFTEFVSSLVTNTFVNSIGRFLVKSPEERVKDAWQKAVDKTATDNESWKNDALRQIDDVIEILIKIMDDPKYLDNNKLPSYLDKKVIIYFSDNVKKDPKAWNYLRQVHIENLLRELRNYFNERDEKFNTSKGSNNPTEYHTLTSYPMKVDSNDVIGRDKDLNKLWKALLEQHYVMLTGFRGIGKTKLAQLLFHKYKSTFDEVAWINYQGNLKNSILDSINVPQFDEKNFKNKTERWNAIISSLRKDKKKKLFIIDNVDNTVDQQPEQDYELYDLTCWDDDMTILLTSRLEQLNGFKSITLDFLELEKCIDVFKHYYRASNPDQETIVNIIELANRHTMTIELLARGVGREDLVDYYNMLINKGFESIDRTMIIGKDKEDSTIVCHLKNLFDIQNRTEMDKRILNSFAILPDKCECVLKNIKQWFGFKDIELDVLIKDGWLSYDNERKTFFLHPLVRTIVRFDFKKDWQNKQNIAPKGTPDNILEFFKNHPYLFTIKNNRDFGYVEWMIGIAESVLNSIDHEESERIAALYYNIGLGYNELGEYGKALKLFKKALIIREKILKVTQANIATTYSNIGGVYHYQNNCDKALEFYNKALSIWEKYFKKKKNLFIAASYNNLGGAYRGKCHYEKALEYHEMALTIRECYNKNSLDVAKSYNNIGTVHKYQGNYRKAEEYYKNALDIAEKSPKKDARFLSKLYYNIGKLYEDINHNDNSDALKYYTKAYQIRKEVFGENHPDTKEVLKSINKLK